MPRAVGIATFTGQLSREHQPLIGAQAPQRLPDRAQLVARSDLRLHAGASIYHLHTHLSVLVSVCPGEWDGPLELGLQGAAPTKRPMPVSYAREKTQLERICDVLAARVRTPHSSVCDELEASLGIAVFEILATQPMPVHAEQQGSSRARHDCDLLCRIERATTAYRTRFVG